MRITNPINGSSVMRDTIVDAGFALNLMMDEGTAKELNLDPTDYDFQDRPAQSASGDMTIKQVSRGKLKIA